MTSPEDYCSQNLPPEIVEKLEAGAFRSLCEHLQLHSDAVQNIDLMALSGFCRNCLAKWMVLEARRLVDGGNVAAHADDCVTKVSPVQALNAFGYDEAAQHIYGMTYGDWKDRHQKKATAEQREKYNASMSIQAKHDKTLLATRADPATVIPTQTNPKTLSALSNVCCQDIEEVVASELHDATSENPLPRPAKGTREVGPFQIPPLPSIAAIAVAPKIGILTVSDRAANNEYVTGDLSGPAVAESIHTVFADSLHPEIISAIVPDDTKAIQDQIVAWSDGNMDLILTTGGTGMSARDITPEATRSVVDQECPGLMAFVTTECSRLQPLACLSRGTAGLRGNCLIANLPGNPKGAQEVVPILLPLLMHALVDIRSEAQ